MDDSPQQFLLERIEELRFRNNALKLKLIAANKKLERVGEAVAKIETYADSGYEESTEVLSGGEYAHAHYLLLEALEGDEES